MTWAMTRARSRIGRAPPPRSFLGGIRRGELRRESGDCRLERVDAIAKFLVLLARLPHEFQRRRVSLLQLAKLRRESPRVADLVNQPRGSHELVRQFLLRLLERPDARR